MNAASMNLSIDVSAAFSGPAYLTAPVQTYQSARQAYANGTAAGGVDLVYQGSLVVGSAGASLNLGDGSLRDALGGALVFAHVSSLVIAVTGLTGWAAGGNFIAATLGAQTLGAGGKRVLDEPAAPIAVGANTTITLTASGTAATGATIIIAGTSV